MSIDERPYRKRLNDDLWRYAHDAGLVARVTTAFSRDGILRLVGDLDGLANQLPYPPAETSVEAIAQILVQRETRSVQELNPAHVLALMKGENTPVSGLEEARKKNLEEAGFYVSISKAIHNYMARVWPRGKTAEQLAEELDLLPRMVRRCTKSKEMRVADFIVLMRALGHPPIPALRELVSEIETAIVR